MIYIRPTAFAALILSWLAAAPVAFAEAITVTDVAGRQVAVEAPVERAILGEGRQLYILAALDREDPARRIAAWRNDLKEADPATYRAYLRGTRSFHAIWHQFYNSPYQSAAIQQIAKWLHPELFADLDPGANFRRLHYEFLPVDYQGGYWVSLSDNVN